MKVKNLVSIVFVLICLAALIYVGVFSNNSKAQHARLEEEGIIDTAVVVRDFIGAKRRLFYEYEFIIDNVRHNGFLKYSPSYGPVSVGDSCLVIYLPEDPTDVNELVKGNDSHIMKVE